MEGREILSQHTQLQCSSWENCEECIPDTWHRDIPWRDNSSCVPSIGSPHCVEHIADSSDAVLKCLLVNNKNTQIWDHPDSSYVTTQNDQIKWSQSTFERHVNECVKWVIWHAQRTWHLSVLLGVRWGSKETIDIEGIEGREMTIAQKRRQQWDARLPLNAC